MQIELIGTRIPGATTIDSDEIVGQIHREIVDGIGYVVRALHIEIDDDVGEFDYCRLINTNIVQINMKSRVDSFPRCDR